MNLWNSISLSGSTWKGANSPIKRLFQNIPALIVRNFFLTCSLNLVNFFVLLFCANLVFKWLLSLPGIFLLGVFIGSSHVTLTFHCIRLEKTGSYIVLSEEMFFIPFFMIAAYFSTFPIHSSWSGQDWALLCVFLGSFQRYRMTCATFSDSHSFPAWTVAYSFIQISFNTRWN